MFIFGKSYGLKSFKESEEYKKIIAQNEETNFVRSDLENLKTKVQNILDQAETKKTDELLAQILQVFLADLGMQIANKDNLIRIAAECKPQAVSATITPSTASITPLPAQAVTPAQTPAPKIEKKWASMDVNKYKSQEWILQNANSNNQIFKQLERIRIKNISKFLGENQDAELEDIEKFIGYYKGDIKNELMQRHGSLSMRFKKSEIQGSPSTEIEILMVDSNGKGDTKNFKATGGIGYKHPDLNSLVLNWGKSTFLQIYKQTNGEKISGNYYENLPNGTTKTVGSFVLNRVDKL